MTGGVHERGGEEDGIKLVASAFKADFDAELREFVKSCREYREALVSGAIPPDQYYSQKEVENRA
jgi:hypothetical protein